MNVTDTTQTDKHTPHDGTGCACIASYGKNDFTFRLIFGLSPNLGLSDSLSKRLIQKVKLPIVTPTRKDVGEVYRSYLGPGLFPRKYLNSSVRR